VGSVPVWVLGGRRHHACGSWWLVAFLEIGACMTVADVLIALEGWSETWAIILGLGLGIAVVRYVIRLFRGELA
jgi:hypothetical protein